MEYNRILKETSAYNDIARSNQQQDIRQLTNTLVGEELIARFEQKALIEDFPDPALVWIDSRASPVSQLEAYRWLSPIEGRRFLQLGGSGSHAIKAMMGGAGQSWLITPMVEEGNLAKRMAAHLEMPRCLHVVQGIGEQIPFADNSIDRIYGGGTLHHMDLNYGLGEIARVLKPGGRAAFVDPNLNFIYRLLEATRIRNLARERGAQCYPLRVRDVYDNAPDFSTVKCLLSGGPVRYAIVGIIRVLKLRFPRSLSLLAQSLETKVLLRLKLQSMLGSLVVLLEK